VLKPKHSAFYSTALELLLEHLGARTLILTGLLADSCILLTAYDAHMRGYDVVVLSDCVAARTARDQGACAGPDSSGTEGGGVRLDVARPRAGVSFAQLRETSTAASSLE